VGPLGIAVPYRYRAPGTGGTYDLAVRFRGFRIPDGGEPTDGERLDRVERVTGLPATGEVVTLTARIPVSVPGIYRVLAEPLATEGGACSTLPRRVVEATAQMRQLAQGPHVRVWSWPLLILLGTAVALTGQALLAGSSGLPWITVSLLSILGCLAGVLGGKLWFLGLHRQPLGQFMVAGSCIQGFLVAALGVLAGGTALLDMSVGAVLDVTTPAVFVGMAVGRPGCFFAGCCTGRPTGSAWGLVSSDRRLAVRRVPVQLMEAATALVIAAIGAILVLSAPPLAEGSTFAASFSAYVLARQWLFRFRVDSHTQRGRRVTTVFATAILVGALYLGYVSL
jgi:phosphatidylglycerol---prolipoprotein diacylglyceryl transferase